MLVLTRKKEQSIHIGDDIVVQVVSVQGDKVRLGISAPKDVAIVRPDAKRVVGGKLHESECPGCGNLVAHKTSCRKCAIKTMVDNAEYREAERQGCKMDRTA